jgi:hypothetical protein
MTGPPLWSCGQSSWLQIQRSVFDSRRYQIFWEVVGLERGPLSLVSATEELHERNSSGFGLESREYGRRDPSRWPCGTLYPQKLALTSLTSGGRYSSLPDSGHGVNFILVLRGWEYRTEQACLLLSYFENLVIFLSDVYTIFFSHMSATCPALPWLHDSLHAWRSIQVMKLLIMHMSPTSSAFKLTSVQTFCSATCSQTPHERNSYRGDCVRLSCTKQLSLYLYCVHNCYESKFSV